MILSSQSARAAAGDPSDEALPDRPPARRRMDPDVRADMILEGAVRFFARNGFTAQTRELARELGVSQALIFRYFPNKDVLIEKVYQRNFMERFSADWEVRLADRDMALRERLIAFYSSYLGVIDDYDWIRITLHSGLSNNMLTKRYVEAKINRLLEAIARESAHHERRPFPENAGADGAPSCDDEAYERVFHLHSTFIYYLVRKHVLGTRVIGDRSRLIEIAVDSYLGGLGRGADAAGSV